MPQNTRQTVAIVDCFDSLRLRWRGRQDVFVGPTGLPRRATM